MIKKIIYVVLFTLALLIVTLNVASSFKLSVFGIRSFKVGSGSMEPTLKVNDLIIIKEQKNYKKDDIVTFVDGNTYVTHRVVSVDGDTIITRGDANNTDDDPISKDIIVGKLIYRFKAVGFISYLFANPFSWVLLFVVGIAVTCFIPEKKEKQK